MSWRKSPRCDTNTCLEISTSSGLLWLRNSAEPGVTVSFTPTEWQVFQAALVRGDFSDLVPDPDREA